MEVREKVLNIGKPQALSGILSSVDGGRTDTVFIILNSGVVHRIGACRLSVELARQLAGSTGMPSVRFDYSGLGDSPTRRSALSRNELVESEIVEVMDHLQSTLGAQSFILFGLCSGARDAVHTAEKDQRVKGVVQLDGYAFRNSKYYCNHYLAKISSLTEWRRFIFKAIPNHVARFRNKFASKAEAEPTDSAFGVPIESIWGAYLPRDTIAQMYTALVSRGVQQFVHFTGSWTHVYNYPKQFFDVFSDVDFGGSVHEQFHPDLDHIHSDPQGRRQLIDSVVAWVAARWPKML